MMSLKFVAIKLLAALHFLIVVFVIFGCLFTSHNILLFHLVFLPILVLHWKTNEGICYLTQLENKIIAKPIHKAELQGGFTEAMFKRIFGKKPSRAMLQNLTYVLMSISWMISILKYINLP